MIPVAQSVVRQRVSRRDYRSAPSDDLLGEITAFVEEAPPRERERRRRLATLEAATLDATHPPTARRIALLEARPSTTPVVVLDEGRSRAIDAELAPDRARVAAELVDTYRGYLYS